MNIKGTESEQNLKAALAGESMARNKYTFYAMAARKAGEDKVADALERMAKNEMMHAKFWFEALHGETSDTLANLREAAQGELQEWHSMYPAFAAKAREEGLETLAVMFEHVADIERDHERQFMSLCAELMSTRNKNQAQLAAEVPAPKTQRQGYRCMFCGAVYPTRPDVCTVCKAIGSFENCTYEA